MTQGYSIHLLRTFARTIGFLFITWLGVSAQTANQKESPTDSAARGKMNEPTGFYCNAKALGKEERASYNELTKKLMQGRAQTKELTDGYAFQLQSGVASISDLALWVSYERKCCPFFTFEIELENSGRLWLKLKGVDGIKPFIRAEFGIA